MMEQERDPFSSYRLSSKSQPQKPATQENSEDQFSAYKIKKPEESSFASEIPRHAARIASRVAETIGGIPGDIQDLLQAGALAGLEKVSGREVSPENRKKAKELSGNLPSSSELQEFSEKKTKGLTKAKNPTEELIDDYTKTVSSLLGPLKFRKALGVAALGIGAKKGTEILGLGEGAQEASKLGTMIIASMFNPKGVKQLTSNYYNQAFKLAPEGVYVSSKPLESKLNILRKKLKEGIEAPSEKAVLDDLEKVAEKIQGGKVEVRQMMAANRSINERMGDPALLARGKSLYPELKKAVNDSIKLYKNPEFLKAWKSSNEAFSGVKESQKLSNFIQKHLGNMPIKHALFASAAEAAAGYPEAIVPTLAASSAAFAGIKGIELTKRIMANPTLRKYYQQMLFNASKENAVAMTKAAEKLQEGLEKQED